MTGSAPRRLWFVAVAGVTGALTAWYCLWAVEPFLSNLGAAEPPAGRLLTVGLGAGLVLGASVALVRDGGMAAHRHRRIVLGTLLGFVLVSGLVAAALDTAAVVPSVPPWFDSVLAGIVLLGAYAAGYREWLFSVQSGEPLDS